MLTNTNLNASARNASLELCDVIVDNIERSYDSVELCEHIIAQCEFRATARHIQDQVTLLSLELFLDSCEIEIEA